MGGSKSGGLLLKEEMGEGRQTLLDSTGTDKSSLKYEVLFFNNISVAVNAFTQKTTATG